MDSMRRMNAYVKLNFQRCLSQGKTLVAVFVWPSFSISILVMCVVV